MSCTSERSSSVSSKFTTGPSGRAELHRRRHQQQLVRLPPCAPSVSLSVYFLYNHYSMALSRVALLSGTASLPPVRRAPGAEKCQWMSNTASGGSPVSGPPFDPLAAYRRMALIRRFEE